jgi:hypothetical protein
MRQMRSIYKQKRTCSVSSSFRLTISKLVNVWIGARKQSKISMETKYLRLRVMV